MELNKIYIVFCSERSDGAQCNEDYIWLVESPIEPTKDLIIANGFVHPGNCTNVSQAGCENCGGSYIVSFHVEPYSPENAKELGILENRAVDKLQI